MVMKINKIVISIIVVFLVCIACLVYLTFKKINPSELWSWSFFDVVELFLTGIIGIFIGYYLSVAYPVQLKRNELTSAHMDIILEDAKYIIKLTEQRKDKELSVADKKDLVKSFRMIHNDFLSLQKIIQKHSKRLEQKLNEILPQIHSFKAALTDKPFVDNTITYEDYEQAFDIYYLIKSKINFLKISLFS